MPERRKTETPSRLIDRYRAKLAIDRDDLDRCMVEQPELVDHVGEAYANAVAARAAGKVELEIAEAEETQKIRERPSTMDEKLTEASLREQLVLSKRIQNLKTEQIQLRREITNWSGLGDYFKSGGF